jgi:hypothetical protein
MPLQVLDGPVIEAGEALSNGIDCSAGQLVRVTMPEGWSRAPLTFQISTDGTFYNDLFGLDGYEVTLSNVEPGSAVVVPHGIGIAVGWLKVRSGTRDNPVPQSAARLFAVALVADAAAPAGQTATRREE